MALFSIRFEAKSDSFLFYVHVTSGVMLTMSYPVQDMDAESCCVSNIIVVHLLNKFQLYLHNIMHLYILITGLSALFDFHLCNLSFFIVNFHFH